tara:strand:- start:2480 stop:3343 length:864 start_codon:yes stop_codon:yes gene_type:complete
MGTKVKAPPARDYGKETRDTLQAQIDLAPDLYAAEEKFRGKYAQLDLDIAKQLAPDLLNLYETSQRRLGALDRETLAAQREADISAIEDYGTRAMQGYRAAADAANPEQAALMAELNKQALSDLQLGGQLNASEQRDLQQAARGAQAARGFGYGINDAAIESWAQMQGSDQRRRQRQGFAQSMAGLNQSNSVDPFMAILGRPSSMTPAMTGSFVGQAQGFNPGAMFSPESQYAADIYNQNYQGQLAARTATAKNRASMIGAGIGAFGKMTGSSVAAGKGMFGGLFGG